MSGSGAPIAVLIGPPGAGKSTVGRLLADARGVAFVDTDQLVQQRSGRSISDIFVEEGEAAFRTLEVEATREALHGNGVVALGGGAPMQAAIAELLAGHRVVFLDVTIADAAGRIGFDGSRPLLAVNPRATWTRMMKERRPTYESLASVRVDTGGRTPQQVVQELDEQLEQQ
ncbi:shikimate kinase [Yimella sp. cx-51]|uniref:shikimate kinase n=1 Tax=Yimella sp. cx-51 TaxID=2770551 RepID=UPI001AD8964B|nr:shikimate kinase [Yimella sp. cx-51]QTH39250.1 shikimate kinase [Yimella sp. cx-51]